MINGLEEKLDNEFIVEKKEENNEGETGKDTLIKVLEKYTQAIFDLIKEGKCHSHYSESECNYSVYK